MVTLSLYDTTIIFGDTHSITEVEFFVRSDLEYSLGSENSAFSGFLYEFSITHEKGSILNGNFDPPLCEFNEFWDPIIEKCQACDPACPTWPWCVRSTSCVTCYTENCNSCTGFDFFNCTECNNLLYTAPYCDDAQNCVSGKIFECTECISGYFLVEGVCIIPPFNYQNPATTPSISIKFDNIQETYSVFQSGSTLSTYSPFNSPEADDPSPIYNRGMYFSSTSYLISKEPIGFGCTFSYAAWILSFSDVYNPVLVSNDLIPLFSAMSSNSHSLTCLVSVKSDLFPIKII